MRALTVRQPWADLILAGVKDVENRTWEPPSTLPQWGRNPRDGTRVMPGEWGPGKYDDVFGAYEPDGPFPFRLWIHAAKKPARSGWQPLACDQDLADIVTRAVEPARLGELIGSVTVTGCHHADECFATRDDIPGRVFVCSRWAEPDCFHWQLTDPQPLDVTIPMRGRQRLWRLPEGVAA